MEATSALMQRATAYVSAHRDEFDPDDSGRFYGDALCDLLGGADYQGFHVRMMGSATDVVIPVFGEFVDESQFDDTELKQLRDVSRELDAVATTLGERFASRDEMLRLLPAGSDDWTVARAIAEFVDMPAPLVSASGQKLMDALFVTAFFVLNAKGGLLDMTNVVRPWSGPNDQSDQT